MSERLLLADGPRGPVWRPVGDVTVPAGVTLVPPRGERLLVGHTYVADDLRPVRVVTTRRGVLHVVRARHVSELCPACIAGAAGASGADPAAVAAVAERAGVPVRVAGGSWRGLPGATARVYAHGGDLVVSYDPPPLTAEAARAAVVLMLAHGEETALGVVYDYLGGRSGTGSARGVVWRVIARHDAAERVDVLAASWPLADALLDLADEGAALDELTRRVRRLADELAPERLDERARALERAAVREAREAEGRARAEYEASRRLAKVTLPSGNHRTVYVYPDGTVRTARWRWDNGQRYHGPSADGMVPGGWSQGTGSGVYDAGAPVTDPDVLRAVAEGRLEYVY